MICSFKEFITEVFNQPYSWSWIKRDILTDKRYGTFIEVEAAFKAKDGSKVVTNISGSAPLGSPLDVSINFDRNGSQRVTESGDAFRIFSTVMDVIQSFLKEHDPQLIRFFASEYKAEYGEAPSGRSKLYSAMVTKFAAKNGYTFEIKKHKSDGTTEFILQKKKER